MDENKTNRSKRIFRPISIAFDGKIPPQAIDLEEVVLGSIILEYNKCFNGLAPFLSVDVFYKEKHQLIYKAITSLIGKGLPVDMITVTVELRSQGTLEQIGGAFAITQLTAPISSSANAQHYAVLLYEKYLLRCIIAESSVITTKAFEDNADPLILADRATRSFGDIQAMIDLIRKESSSDTVDSILNDIERSQDKHILNYFPTGYNKFDNIIGIASNEITLIGGPAGHGKTRFLISLMKRLIEAFPKKISIQWFAFEDPSDKIIRCFASNHLFIKEKILRGKGSSKLTPDEIHLFKNYLIAFKEYDIEFVTESKFIKQVNGMFQTFCRKRPDRLNICIIDNLLLLEDNSNDRDDIIAKELVKMRTATKGLIFPVHHFNDDQMEKEQKKFAYRPRVVHLKGRESYRRACTQILLINKPGEYPDLVSEYRGFEDVLKYLYIVEVAKNRDGTANEDAMTLIRMWADLDFLYFKEI